MKKTPTNPTIKTVGTIINNYVDTETGEIIDIDVAKHRILVSSELFSLVYASFWDAVCQTNLSKSDIELLSILIKDYSDGNLFNISKPLLQKLSAITNKEMTSYKNSTRKLVAAEFIIPQAAKTYIINPKYAFKGSSSARKKAILTLETK